ncbi:MAG: DNA primase [Acidobacteria bacterium]|nr:DNA primase [Acidobacteriota bacterium]MXZ38984.1 DNA primase [Holophagales bacterium]MYF04180.1 DNA primase [Holophagales bacterium]MYJ26984.1 DNA primase [Holophagales bacterium]
MQRRSGFTDGAVDAVREAVDIIDLVSEHTRVERRGERFVALCPFHKEKTPSLSLDRQNNLYYCFGCGAGGDAFKFHMELTGDNFTTALEHLARRYGVPLERASGPDADARAERNERIQAALDAAHDFFRSKLRTEAVPQQYLQRRKVPSELIARFGVGYAPDDWRTMIEDLGRRIPVPDLEAAGLIARSQKAPDRPYDRFRNRLMFPIRDVSGRVVAFGGRTLGDDQAKYVNTNETSRFSKGRLLYGLDAARRAIREQGRALLVEGYFDVLGAAASGIDWAVASMGTALTEQQVRLLSHYTDEVVLGYDGDRAGIEAARKAAALMLGAGLHVRRARFPAGQDPDSLRLDDGPEAVRATVAEAQDAVQLEIDDLPDRGELDPRLRAREARRVLPLISRIRNPIVRSEYERIAAERLGLSPELMREAAGDDQQPAPGSTKPAGVPRAPLTASIEEQVLRLTAAAPDLRGIEWPAPDAFFDPALRVIYEAMREQAQAGAERIDSGALVDVLGRRRGTDNETDRPVDRIAGLLLQRSSAFSESDESELRVSLAELGRRFARQRLNLLAREINRAQREGDMETLHRMIEEKQQLSRELYGQSGR